MGKGDRKTKRGKIIKGSYGRLRPRKNSITDFKPSDRKKEAPKKKPAAKKRILKKYPQKN